MARIRLSDRWQAFLQGYAMCMDIFPVPPRDLYIRDDAEALRSDWEKVAGDMRRAMERMQRETASRPHTAAKPHETYDSGKEE